MSDKPATNGSDWVKCPGRIAFMEHDRVDGKGRVLERVDKARLQHIARVMNERDRKGQLCPITPGHTDDGAPETAQPPHWGYAREWEVAYDPDKKKYVLKACWYLRREHYEAARSFPNVSPEYWHADALLDPISLLRRTPRLDLGQWTYAKGGRVVRYALENHMADSSKPEDKGAHKASSDPAEKGDPPAHKERTAETPQNAEGGGGSGLEGLDPHFHEQFKMAMHHHYMSGEHHRYMGMTGHHYGMGMAGPTNGTLPGGEMPGGHNLGPQGEHVSRMAKNQEDIEHSQRDRELQELRGTVRALEQQSIDNAHERDFYALMGQGYQLNVAKEVGRTRSLRGKDYEEYLSGVKENYRRTAGHEGDQLIHTRGGDSMLSPNPERDGEDRPLEQSEMEPYYRHQRDEYEKTGKYPAVEESIKYAKKQRSPR